MLRWGPAWGGVVLMLGGCQPGTPQLWWASAITPRQEWWDLPTWTIEPGQGAAPIPPQIRLIDLVYDQIMDPEASAPAISFTTPDGEVPIRVEHSENIRGLSVLPEQDLELEVVHTLTLGPEVTSWAGTVTDREFSILMIPRRRNDMFQ